MRALFRFFLCAAFRRGNDAAARRLRPMGAMRTRMFCGGFCAFWAQYAAGLRLWRPMPPYACAKSFGYGGKCRHTPAPAALCARRLPCRAAALRAYAQPPRYGTFGAIRAATGAPPIRAPRAFHPMHRTISPLKHEVPASQKTKNAPANAGASVSYASLQARARKFPPIR